MVEPCTLEHATIYGHGVWHYLISTTIGDIHVVEYEGKGMSLETKLILADKSKAEKMFKDICRKMLDGRSATVL